MRKVGLLLGALLCAGLVFVLKRDTSVPNQLIPASAVLAQQPDLAKAPTFNWTNAAARFREASVIAERTTFDPVAREKTIVEVVKTRSKYPHIRVETPFAFDTRTQAWVPQPPIEYVADQVLLEMKPGVTDKQLAGALAKLQARVVQKHPVSDSTLVLIGLPQPAIDAVPEAITHLVKSPGLFEVVEPHFVRRASAIPNDPRFYEQWALQNIDAPAAWDIQRGNGSVVVAVVDSGIDYFHPDLSTRVWANPGEIAGNGIDEDGNGYTDDHRGINFAYNNTNPYDDDDHGTFVSGLIAAAGNDGRGITGVGWNLRIMPVKVMDGDGLLFAVDAILGLDYARLEGARIVNASFGGYQFSQSEYNAITRLRNSGVLLIAAAGNSGYDNDTRLNYPSSYPHDNIVAVAYSHAGDGLSVNSNYGRNTVDLAAPGVSVLSTLPGGTYSVGSGSSFAAPHVAGVAALLKAQNPAFNYSQIKAAILNNVDRQPSMSSRCVSGGRLNAYEALITRIPLAEALDSGALVWQTGGSRPWFGHLLDSSDGVDAARCGKLADLQNSWVQTTVTGPGRLWFYWRVSSESFFDTFQFTVNGQYQDAISGEIDWEEHAYDFPAGTHTLQWTYRKDGGASGGQDKAWLDQVWFARDAGPPVITITSPASTNLLASDVQLQGTATDSFNVTTVECRVINGGGMGPWQAVSSANGFANWQVQLSGLALGTNLVRLRAVDEFNQTSVVHRTYLVLSPLTVNIAGCGSVESRFMGATWQQAGKTLSIRATPCAGHLFTHWSGDRSSSNAVLTFVMQPNLTLQANFVPNLFTPVAGFYNGLFHEPGGVLHESSGLFKSTLFSTGVLSGSIVLGGATNTFSTRFDPVTGQSGFTIPRPGKSAVQLALQVDLTGGSDEITGQVSDGVWTADLVADRLVFHATTNPPPFAGMYTLVFPGSPDHTLSPSGHGFATATVNTSGRVSIDGRLGDNARVLQSIPVSKNGDWPFYQPLYAGNKGSALGWLKFLAPTDFTNQLTSWIRPSNPAAVYYSGGFSNELSVLGSRYVVPTSNRVIDCTNALLTLSGADFAEPITNRLVLTASNTVLNIGPYNASMTIVRTNGTFSGRIIFPRRTNTFQGVFLQQQNLGLGYYIGSNYIGEVRFEAE